MIGHTHMDGNSVGDQLHLHSGNNPYGHQHQVGNGNRLIANDNQKYGHDQNWSMTDAYLEKAQAMVSSSVTR